jgi:hypothetical protein
MKIRSEDTERARYFFENGDPRQKKLAEQFAHVRDRARPRISLGKPDETLQKIRELVLEILEHSEYTGGEDLAEQFQALDVWLTTGGNLPKDWEFEPLKNKKPITKKKPCNGGATRLASAVRKRGKRHGNAR